VVSLPNALSESSPSPRNGVGAIGFDGFLLTVNLEADHFDTDRFCRFIGDSREKFRTIITDGRHACVHSGLDGVFVKMGVGVSHVNLQRDFECGDHKLVVRFFVVTVTGTFLLAPLESFEDDQSTGGGENGVENHGRDTEQPAVNTCNNHRGRLLKCLWKSSLSGDSNKGRTSLEGEVLWVEEVWVC
jgi:hypothetical protein